MVLCNIKGSLPGTTKSLIFEGAIDVCIDGTTVILGPNSTLKSITACCLAINSVRGDYGSPLRYRCILETSCEERIFDDFLWIGPERVIAPYLGVLQKAADTLRENNLPGYEELEYLYPWVRLLQESASVGYGLEYVVRISEDCKRRVEELLEVSWDFDIMPLDLVVVKDRVEFVDKRTHARLNPFLISTGIAATIVYRVLLVATINAFVNRDRRLLVVVEEPEEQAHPYAQFALGYLLGYIPYRLARDGAKLSTLVTTHSEYVLTGIFVGAKDGGATINNRPRVYVMKPSVEGQGIKIYAKAWEPGESIPGFFDESLKMLSERFEAYESLWAGTE
ncbi:MAG: hypothetical protein GXO32_06410 [Crenarchaeota archaeon]|nr:hypothetical protein [Thermoproteota archaeon]